MFEQPYYKMHFDKRDYPMGPLFSRLRFRPKLFAKRYNLGKPVGANFYKMRYDLE
jgi:type II restriction/modification system DNA methylase subunit YeeA